MRPEEVYGALNKELREANIPKTLEESAKAVQALAEAREAEEMIPDDYRVLSTTILAESDTMQRVSKEVEEVTYGVDGRIKKFYTSSTTGTLTDSDEGVIRDLKAFGKSEQETTNGYQLLEKNYDSEFDYSAGQGQKTAATIKEKKFINGETYTASFESDFGGTIRLQIHSVASGYKLIGNFEKNANVFTKTFTVPDDFGVVDYLLIQCSSSVVSGSFYAKNYMVEKGSVAHDFEPYTGGIPAPNPEYPQPITSVEQINITKSSVNLFNGSQQTLSIDGVTYELDGSIAHVSGTSKGNRTVKVAEFMLDAGTYSFSVKASVDTRFAVYDAETKTAINGAVTLSSPVKHFTLAERKSVSLDLYTLSGVTINEDVEYMLVKGNNLDINHYIPYSAPETTTITPPFQMNAIGEYKDMLDVENGVWVKRLDSVILDGSHKYNTTGYSNKVFAVSILIGLSFPTTDYVMSDMYPGVSVFSTTKTCIALSSFSNGFAICDIDDEKYKAYGWDGVLSTTNTTMTSALKAYHADHHCTVIYPIEEQTFPISAEDLEWLRNIRTHYSATNIFITDQNGNDISFMFNYPLALEPFVENIKTAMGDDRKFLYNLEDRIVDEEYNILMAYVDSEFAAALVEL